jgi:hypothetical protein
MVFIHLKTINQELANNQYIYIYNIFIIEGGKGEGIIQRNFVEKKKRKKTLSQARTCEISFPFSPYS